jgi:hypothetical protein
MKSFLVLLLLWSSHHVVAQDAVAVSKEPRHKNVFENKYLRVLDVHIAPGDTTQLHKHETPSVFISLHPVKTGSQVIIEDGSATVLSIDRKITFEGFYESPRIHRVWNEDTSVFHVMDIEILSKGNKNKEAPIATESIKLLFEAPVVRAYRVTLGSNQEIKIERKAAILIVGLTDASNVMINKKSFKKEGDFLFIPPSEKIKLVNGDQQEYSFALLELK